ncbi:MAG: DNA primase [Alphaproteobacteria bacterium]
MSFPPAFLEELRERVSLVGTVGRRVRLVRRGREHTGLCPFHTEKTPSFTVSDDKGFYHCFGCGAHGDAISFIMGTEGLSFPEAVERLAGEAGMAVPRPSPEEAARAERTRDLHAVLEAACLWFEKQLRLPEGKAGLDYLHGRGLDDAVIGRFRLGFAPDRRGALAAALSRDGVAPDMLREAGLLKQADDGRDYEYFRARVVFPIGDRRGRVVGFGGRTLGDQQPKYLNSPETALFHKGRVLYNHARARAAAAESGEVVVVEGYMDVIALERAGIGHAVAPLGTAVTEEQIEALWRMAPEPVLCLDGDAAGRRAAVRAAERAMPLLRPGLSLRFAALPPGDDPDTLLAQSGPDALRAALAAGRPLADLVWGVEYARHPVDTPERRAALAARLREAAGRVGDPDVRAFYHNDFRARLSALFAPAAGRFGGKQGGWHGARQGGGPVPRAPLGGVARGVALAGRRSRVQQAVLATLLNHPDMIHEFGERLAALRFADGRLDGVRAAILNHAAAADMLDGSGLRAQLNRAGFGEAVETILRPEIVMHAACARPGADSVRVRLGLMHLLDRAQEPVLLKELDERVARVDDLASDDELDGILGLVVNERARIATPDEG